MTKLPRPKLPLLRPQSKTHMSSSSSAAHSGPSSDVDEFARVLRSSRRVAALCGAGLSAASGLDTFRGAGGMWRNHQATALATPEAFARDPGLVWLFYSYRRHRALRARPNAGHVALARLAERMPGFVTLTQNVDGLSQRANHPREQLKLLHGTLFDITCFNPGCNYVEQNNYDDPYHPVLAIDSAEDDRLSAARNETSSGSSGVGDHPVSANAPATINPADLPHCPKCRDGLLRPGVVWFGERLPADTLSEVDEWMDHGKVDLIMVIGTTAMVWPAAGYVEDARARGARVCVVNMDSGELGAAGQLRTGDFLFEGDASEILPRLLRDFTGEVEN